MELNMICDTGSPCTLMPKRIFNKIASKVKLIPCSTTYYNYSGAKIDTLGEFEATVTHNSVKRHLVIIVSNHEGSPLLGRDFLKEFNFELNQVNMVVDKEQLINDVKRKYADVFEGTLGKYKLTKVSLPISDKAKPIFCKPRPIPLAWKSKVESELRDLIEKGVLKIVDHSEWGTPLVPILKPNGNIRICGDYKVTINKHLIDYNYPLPRIEEIHASLGGGVLYTKLDLSHAYNQLELDEDSQKLCTWSTHIGTLAMTRLPFGVKPAASIFQKMMESLFREIENVVVYQDDITITGNTFDNHVENLNSVLKKLSMVGLKVNTNKCEFFKEKISYLGFTIDKDGISKNQDRCINVLNAPTPKNLSELRAFIGMANYYSKFIFNFSKKMSPLYGLLKKGVKFVWTDDCKRSYEQIKKDISSDQVLIHFNPNLPIIVSTDASNNAVAGILSHKLPNNTTRPIAFTSRALNNAEKNYSTLEKEALAIIYSITKFKQYLLGHNFILKTDHKPLVSILGENKGLPIMAAARMQRWAFTLSGFQYKIEYVKGSINYADHLSRIPQICSIHEQNDKSYIDLIESEQYLKTTFKEISRETRRDPVLSKVCEAIKTGKLALLVDKQFDTFRNKELELTVEQECILWGYRVIIPASLRMKILNELHRSHLGIVKTKGLARSHVWWPKIDSDVENLIKNCTHCQALISSPPKSSLIPWEPAQSVWSRIHIDIAGPINNFYLLVIIDSFSKWVEVFKTKDITSSFVISKLRQLFWNYGLIDVLVSDNGRQFISKEFEDFLKLNNVKHALTAPGQPSTNGQAENFIKTLKKSIIASMNEKKIQNFDIILNQFLFDYRNTPHSITGESPSKLFFGRTLKSRFSWLRPPLTRNKIIDTLDKTKNNYRGKRDDQYCQGDKVYVKDYKDPNKTIWSEATVKDQLGPRTYTCVYSHNNKLVKRHLDQIRGLHNQSEPRNSFELNVENSVEQSAAVEIQEPDVSDSRSTLPLVSAEESDGSEISSEQSNTEHQQNNTNVNKRKLRPRREGKVVKSKENDRNL